MAFRQNNHSTQNVSSGTTGSPKRTDDDTIRRIEKDNFNLRRELEEKVRANNVLRENYSKQQDDLADTKAKNQLLERKSIAQEAEIKRTQGLFVNACKKRDPHALNKKLEEINGKLQDTEEQLNTVKNENQNLKRKLSDDHTEYEDNIRKKRRKLAKNCTKLYQCETALKNEQERCTAQTNKLASVHETLKTTKEKITELEGNRDSQTTLIKTQNECIRELKSQVSLFQPAMQEKQRLQQLVEESQKITQDLEQAIENCKSKIKKIQSRNYNLTAKLKRKQAELDSNLVEHNHLFKFAQDVGILIQCPLNSSSPLQTQLPEILAHLKETLQVGGYIVQYQQQNQQHISTHPSASSPPPPQHSSNEGVEDDHDQLYDEFTSKSMMNIRFPLPSSSPQPSTTTTNINSQTVQDIITLPQQSNKAVEIITDNAGNSQDSLFKEIMSNVHKSVKETKLKAKRVNKAKKPKAPAPPRAKRTVITITTTTTQTKKHEEDKSKRKRGRSENCEGGAKYFCVCGLVETSLIRLNIHIVQFNQDKKFKCELCPKRLQYFGHLRYHLSHVHHMPHALDEYVTGCRTCGEMFKKREQYRLHKISAHINSTSPNPVVAIENETKSTTGGMEMATAKVPSSLVTAAPEVQPQPPQPDNVSRRVPSICMDPEDEEVDVET